MSPGRTETAPSIFAKTGRAAVCLRPDGGESVDIRRGVRADACRGQPQVDGSAVQDGGGGSHWRGGCGVDRPDKVMSLASSQLLWAAGRLTEASMINVKNKPHKVTAQVEVPPREPTG